MANIKTISRTLRILFQIVFILVPLFTTFYWIYYKSLASAGIQPDLPVINSELVTNASTRYMAFLVSLLPTAIIMFGLHHIILLLKSFEAGKLFHASNPKRIIKIGVTLLALVIMGVAYDALISFVMTFHNPAGHHVIAISLGMNDFNALIMSGVIIMVGIIFKEACLQMNPQVIDKPSLS